MYNILYITLFYWNIFITVGVLGSLGQELDPVLDLGHPGINTVAGALTAIANNPNLGKSKIMESFKLYVSFWIFNIYIIYTQFTFHSQPPSAGLQSLPGRSP